MRELSYFETNQVHAGINGRIPWALAFGAAFGAFQAAVVTASAAPQEMVHKFVFFSASSLRGGILGMLGTGMVMVILNIV